MQRIDRKSDFFRWGLVLKGPEPKNIFSDMLRAIAEANLESLFLKTHGAPLKLTEIPLGILEKFDGVQYADIVFTFFVDQEMVELLFN